MDTYSLGPNGGLIYCMEYLLDNISWLDERIKRLKTNYVIFDCPGQVCEFILCTIFYQNTWMDLLWQKRERITMMSSIIINYSPPQSIHSLERKLVWLEMTFRINLRHLIKLILWHPLCVQVTTIQLFFIRSRLPTIIAHYFVIFGQLEIDVLL